MWRTGPVCIHSGRAEESFGPRVHREHQGCGSCSGRGEPEMLSVTNRGRSFRWSFWTLSPFTPSCQAFVAAQSQVVSDWSLRAAWKSTLRHFVSFGQSQVKVLLEAVARQKEAETQTEEPTRMETPKKIFGDQSKWMENKGRMMCYEVMQLWVSVQSFCHIPDFFWDAMTVLPYWRALLCAHIRSPKMCLIFCFGASQRVFEGRNGEHDVFVLICPCVLLMQEALANLAATKHDLKAAARGPIPVRLAFLLVEGGFMELW